jgi:hypothetical protein
MSCAALPRRDLLAELAARPELRDVNAVELVSKPKTAADSPDEYVVRAGDERFVLLVASPLSPLLVQRAVERQSEARAMLRGEAADAIEPPLVDGLHDARSYAVWRMRRSLSSNGLLRKLQIARLAPRVFRWLHAVAAQTAAPANVEGMAADLQRLARLKVLEPALRTEARMARAALLAGSLPPIGVLQHGDLWIGNVLRAPVEPGFIAIDWPGARGDGTPFFDLVKFAVSIGARPAMLRRELGVHAALLGCRPEDALAYVLCGLGRLYAELEHFPERRFVALCERKVHAVTSLFKDGPGLVRRTGLGASSRDQRGRSGNPPAS